MAVERIGTPNIYQQVITQLGKGQTDYAELQEQIASGLKADTFKELGADSSLVLDLQRQLSRSSQYQANNVTAISRLKTTESSINNILDLAEDLRNNLLLENSSSGSVVDLETFSRNALDTLKGQLNVTLNGRYLFSGGKTNIQPVESLQFVAQNEQGIALSESYYDGDEVIQTVQSSDSVQVEYGVNANNLAFRTLIGALQSTITAEQTGSQTDLNRAINLVNDAISQIISVQAETSNNIVLLQQTNDELVSTDQLLEENLVDTVGTDIVEASTQVAFIEAQLTAIMQTFSRISSLTLSDYLQ